MGGGSNRTTGAFQKKSAFALRPALFPRIVTLSKSPQPARWATYRDQIDIATSTPPL